MDTQRIKAWAQGWNDAQAGRAAAARTDNALAYMAGYYLATQPAEAQQ